MYVVTFYSYQGGTGRTTALVNVAVDLAKRGRKVLLVDFDLGKPALSNFGPLRPDGPQPGLVEFITEYLHRGRAPAVNEYVYQAKVDERTRGEVWVMPAGRDDDDYRAALGRLDWQDLYAVREGFLLMEDLKAQWQDALQPDYVLIDAQAGINDTTAVCTRQLADDVVLVIVPDQSDLAGIERVMREVFAESTAEGPRRIDIHLVTSKVPDVDGDEPPGRRELAPILEPEDLGIMFDLTAELPYDPALLLERQVVMSRRPGSRLARQYRQLANALILGNCTQDREGAKAFLKQLQLHPERAVGEVDPSETEAQRRWFDSTRRLEQVIRRFTAKRDAEVLGQAASCLFLADTHARAAEVLDEALEQSPADPALLWQRASYRLNKWKSPLFAEDLLTLLDRPPTLWSQLRNPDERRAALLNRLRERPSAPVRLIGLLPSSRLPELGIQPLRHDVLPLETVSGIDSYLVSAVRLLRRHAPERLEEALRMRRVQALSEADRARLLSEQMSDSEHSDQAPEWLIRGKHFRAVIARLDSSVRGGDDPNIDNAFHLAMAYWAVGEEGEATRVSQEALKPWLAGGVQQVLDVLDANAHEMEWLQKFTLLAFRADNLEDAKMLAFHLERELDYDIFQRTDFFSFWRYKTVTFGWFRDDCLELHKMIKERKAHGTVRLPPFLSKSSSGV